MKSVAPALAASSFRPLSTAAGSSMSSDAPRPVGKAGRAWSVGSSSSAGAPARCARQYAACPSRTHALQQVFNVTYFVLAVHAYHQVAATAKH